MSLSLKSLLRLYRSHPWLLIMSLCGLLLGSALVVAIDLINHSARTNFVSARTQVEGQANWRLAPPGGINELRYTELVTTVPHLDAAPQIHAWLRDNQRRPWQLIGIDPLAGGPLDALFSGKAPELTPQNEHAVWLSRSEAKRQDWQIGQSRTFYLGERPLTLTLGGVIDEGSIALDRLLVTDIGLAQQWLGREGRLDRLYFHLDDAARARLEKHLRPGEVLERTGPELDASRLGDALALNLTALSLLALAVGLFLVFNAQRFVLSLRRPHLARLMIIGVSPHQLLKLLVVELLLITGVGTALGMLLGVGLADLLMGGVSQSLSDLYGPNPIDLLRLTPLTFIKSALLCLAGTLAANLPAWRSLLSEPPLHLLTPAALPVRPRLRRGTALLMLLTGTLCLWREESGLVGALLVSACWLLAMALLLPDLLSPLMQALRNRRRQGDGTWRLRLAMAETHFQFDRTAVAVMALQLAIAAAIGIGVMVASFRTSVEQWLHQRLAADLYVTALRDPQGGHPDLPANIVSALEGQSISLSRRRTDEALYQGKPIELVQMDLLPALMRGYPLLAGNLPNGSGEALASEPLMRRYHLRLGERLTIAAPGGEQQLRISGVYRDYGSDKGQLLQAMSPAAPPQSLALFGLTDEQIQNVSERYGEQARLLPARAILTQALAIFDQTFVVTELLKLLILLIAVVGITVAFMVLGLSRAPWQRSLHALGVTRRDTLVLQLWQGAILGVLTAVLALPVGYGLAWVLIEVVNPRAFGWTLAFSPAWSQAMLALLLAPVSAIAASALAWRLTQGANR